MLESRRPTLADLPGVYRVCFETAELEPGVNPDLVGHIYAGPYVVRHPDFARVVADDLGVSGYVLGCPDTRAFAEWCESNWWPALRDQYPINGGTEADRELISLLHSPGVTPDEIVEEFPAHLHIDLLPRTQGNGYGRLLVDWLCSTLADTGAPGVHLGVGLTNHSAIQFYEHLGFETLSEDENARWMAKRL